MRKVGYLFLIGVSSTVATLFSPVAAAQNVAIMGSPNSTEWNLEVQAKLVATGLFSNVDAFDIQSVTPTLAQMQTYDALLVYTDAPSLADATAFGNNLADFVDGGGGVVTAVFATASIPVEGRFNSDNYWAIQPSGQQQGIQEGLGAIFDPSSPILDGVTNFDGGSSSYRPSVDNLHPSAIRIANWTGAGNIPLIATRIINTTCRVDLGFFPPSDDSRFDFWDATTDGDLILANALLTVMFENCIANQPPDCGAAVASTAELWPPDHGFADVSVLGVTDPDGGPVTITVTGIAQDEPPEGLGDGNTCPDGDGVGTDIALVRAERSGPGDGRVYHISFTAEDVQGAACTETVTVCVPHEQGQGNSCLDGVSSFDSMVCGGDLQSAASAAGFGRNCGIGFELAFLLPPLMWLRQQRRRTPS